MYRSITFISIILLFLACGRNQEKNKSLKYPQVGKIERLDPSLDDIISSDALIEVLASDFGWSEGPIWDATGQRLLFTDVGKKMIFQWTEDVGVSEYLSMDDSTDKVGPSALLAHKSELYILRYGHGQVVKMNASLSHPVDDFTIIADGYNGLPFNNTNDAAFHSNGTLIMSDPPSNVEGGLKAGVYQIAKDGLVTLITDTLSSPNGIAFSPDESTIYIANADWKHAIWIAADVDSAGTISNGRILFDATGRAPKEQGHPDGLKVSSIGIIFATGPGGVYIMDPGGKHLGTILNSEFNTNCVLDDKEEFLYITSGPQLMRVKLK